MCMYATKLLLNSCCFGYFFPTVEHEIFFTFYSIMVLSKGFLRNKKDSFLSPFYEHFFLLSRNKLVGTRGFSLIFLLYIHITISSLQMEIAPAFVVCSLRSFLYEPVWPCAFFSWNRRHIPRLLVKLGGGSSSHSSSSKYAWRNMHSRASCPCDEMVWWMPFGTELDWLRIYWCIFLSPCLIHCPIPFRWVSIGKCRSVLLPQSPHQLQKDFCPVLITNSEKSLLLFVFRRQALSPSPQLQNFSPGLTACRSNYLEFDETTSRHDCFPVLRNISLFWTCRGF